MAHTFEFVSISAVVIAMAAGLTPSSRATGHVGPSRAAVHTILAAAQDDSISIESEPAPLLVPGAPPPRDTAVRTRADRAREQLTLGVVMERQGNFPAALMAYQNAAKFDSTLEEASYRLGLLELKWGRSKEAEQAFREELRRNPDHMDASRELAITLSVLGRHAEALERLRKLTAKEPTRDEHWYALGIAYANAGRPRDADQALRRAIALPPDRSIEHRDLAVVLLKLGRPRQAQAEYRAALEIDPRDPTVWINVGNLHARAGRADSALAAYRRAERADSSYADAYEAQIGTLARLRRPDEVADVYVRWADARPDDVELRLRAVRHLAELGRRDRALELGRGGVRQDARSPAAHLVLGMALEAYGSRREALDELRTAERLFQTPVDRQRARTLIRSMREAAPDSLRAMFAADSATHETSPP